jgi:hypothetical protein
MRVWRGSTGNFPTRTYRRFTMRSRYHCTFRLCGDLNTNHARSPMAGIQRVVQALKDFKVEKMTGEVKSGGALSGKIAGNLDKTTFTFDFELNLPAKEAAAGMSCGKQ